MTTEDPSRQSWRAHPTYEQRQREGAEAIVRVRAAIDFRSSTGQSSKAHARQLDIETAAQELIAAQAHAVEIIAMLDQDMRIHQLISAVIQQGVDTLKLPLPAAETVKAAKKRRNSYLGPRLSLAPTHTRT